METKNILLLGSSSASRKMLLQQAQIPFIEIPHTADEDAVDKSLPFTTLLLEIARYKMKHVHLEPGYEGQVVFVLTADSMGKDVYGVVHGKPADRQDALKKLQALSGKSVTATAFCLQKKRYLNGAWHVEKVVERCIEATCFISIPDHWIERYLQNTQALHAAGAIAIELYGAQFLEWVDGSYTAVLGLPMAELREALDEVGFWG